MFLSELIKEFNFFRMSTKNFTEQQKRVEESKQKAILNYFKNISLEEITTQKAVKFVEFLKRQGNKEATINTKLAYLSSLLKYAYQQNYINHKILIPHLKIEAKEKIFLTESDKEKILKWCENNSPEMKQLFLIGIYTGMRISNNIELNPEKDLNNGYFRIYKNKTNNPYSIPVAPTLTSYQLKKINLNYNQVYYLFNKMKKELNLNKEITIHTMRHTFCSDLINKGVPIPVIQKLANHKNINTTMRYAHIKNETLENAISLL